MRLEPEKSNLNRNRILTQLITKDFKQINFTHVFKGTIVGGHYHKDTVEYFFVTNGVGVLETGIGAYLDKALLKAGDFFSILQGTLHRIHAMTDFEFLVFLDKPFDEQNPDIHYVKEDSPVAGNSDKV